MNVTEEKILVYTAYSKHHFYAKEFISAFVLDSEYIPLNPFTNWGYFLSDLVDREKIVRANNNLIKASSEMWCFGPIADGVMFEIRLAMKLNQTIRFFTIGKKISDIREINLYEVVFEDELLEKEGLASMINEINSYLNNGKAN